MDLVKCFISNREPHTTTNSARNKQRQAQQQVVLDEPWCYDLFDRKPLYMDRDSRTPVQDPHKLNKCSITGMQMQSKLGSLACSEILARHRARGSSKPRTLWRCVRCSPVDSNSARLAWLRCKSDVVRLGPDCSSLLPVTRLGQLLSMVLMLPSSLYLES